MSIGYGLDFNGILKVEEVFYDAPAYADISNVYSVINKQCITNSAD